MVGKPDSALKQYQLSIDQNPDMFAPHLNRGRLLQKMHRCDDAMKDFAAALQLVPENGEVYYARSFCFAQKGDRVHALQDIDKAISLGFGGVNKEYYESMKHQ
jgi:tetratricopeptide (TPR) repeat protein